MQSGDHGYAAYITDLAYLLRERAEEAKRASKLDPGSTDFQEGRLMAYIEVLSLMQNQADAFMIPRETLGLGGFDPENEEFRSIPPGKVRGTSL